MQASAKGSLSPAAGIIPPSCTVDGKPYQQVAPSVGFPGYDTTLAKKYFDEYTQGKEYSFNILCTEEYETAIRRIIQKWQQLFGIMLSARVEVAPEDELKARVQTGDYQCAFAPVTADAQTAVEFLFSFRDATNICRYNSENFNKLLAQLLTAGSIKSVAEGCTAAQDYLIQNAVIIPMFFHNKYIATNPKITSVNILRSGNIISFSETELLK